MSKITPLFGFCALALAVPAAPAAAKVGAATVERAADNQVLVRWSAKGPVDVFLADRQDADLASARLVSGKDRDGSAQLTVDPVKRPYVLLRDTVDGTVTEVAERLVPLAQGSNFRDIGGYQTADGRQVRWGLIYRSGGSAMLTDADVQRVQALGLRSMVDLRSNEERVLAPSRIDGVNYAAVGYSMTSMVQGGKISEMRNGVNLYHRLPASLAPQLRILFGILKRGEGPVEYNCSAGQDRTGFTTAMVLSALGVPRETIIKDYLLSTQYRQPRFELPPIDAKAHADNPVALMFASFQNAPGADKAQPLVEADGTPFLTGALDEIQTRWGSVEAYLEQEVGVTAADRELLRRTYLQ